MKMLTTVKADLEFAVKEFNTALGKLKDIENLIFLIIFEPIPVSIIE
jgi:hypothetical protein